MMQAIKYNANPKDRMTKSMHVTWDNRLMTTADTLYEEGTRQIQLKDQAADDKKKNPCIRPQKPTPRS